MECVTPVIASSRRVAERDRLLPVLPLRVGRDVPHRPRPVERDERDQVLELRRPHLPQRLAHARRLELEDADRVAAREHLVRLAVVHRDLLRCRDPPPISATALSITSRFRSPRKSIFRRPSASTSHIPNCVTVSSPSPLRCSGTTSVSGRSEMTTPAAWIESCRTSPSSGFARSTISRTCGSPS